MSLTSRLEWLEDFYSEYSCDDRPSETILTWGRDAGLTEAETVEVWYSVTQGRVPSVEANLNLINSISEAGQQKRVHATDA